jgi:hypothetical protein
MAKEASASGRPRLLVLVLSDSERASRHGRNHAEAVAKGIRPRTFSRHSRSTQTQLRRTRSDAMGPASDHPRLFDYEPGGPASSEGGGPGRRAQKGVRCIMPQSAGIKQWASAAGANVSCLGPHPKVLDMGVYPRQPRLKDSPGTSRTRRPASRVRSDQWRAMPGSTCVPSICTASSAFGSSPSRSRIVGAICVVSTLGWYAPGSATPGA